MYSYHDHIFLFICIGGIFLAAIYHTILFFHRRESLLNYYSQYLWVLLFYLGFRVDLFFDITGLNIDDSPYSWDEMIQMLSFMFYIRFLGKAIFLKKSDSVYAWNYYNLNVPVVIIYCILLLILTDIPAATTVLQIIIRVYLLSFGLLFVIMLIRKKKNLYFNYLFAAAVSMILLGFISSLSMILGIRFFELGPFYWLLFSFFIDVIFFSAALGYLIRQEYLQRESSLKQLLKKEAELQQKELEKIKAVYETREDERLRIARDLHDDMGSTLSSINIYSKVVASYINSDKDKANEFIEKIQYNTNRLIENTTDLIWSLQTNYGETESIFKRMHDTGIELLSSANIALHFLIPPAGELPRLNIAAQKNCWLIFKEAINNVCKYSSAANCSIIIESDADELSLTISDDGMGFNEPQRGNGLANMRQRTQELDGRFTIHSHPGSGATISVCFPLIKISADV